MKLATCNCPVGMKYHALNCPTQPGQPQNLPEWAKPKRKRPVSSQERGAAMDHKHRPVVREVHGQTHIVCGECGLMLDFRALENLGFFTTDWQVERYEAPEVPFQESVSE